LPVIALHTCSDMHAATCLLRMKFRIDDRSEQAIYYPEHNLPDSRAAWTLGLPAAVCRPLPIVRLRFRALCVCVCYLPTAAMEGKQAAVLLLVALVAFSGAHSQPRDRLLACRVARLYVAGVAVPADLRPHERLEW